MGCFSSLPERLRRVTNPFDHPASGRGIQPVAYRSKPEACLVLIRRLLAHTSSYPALCQLILGRQLPTAIWSRGECTTPFSQLLGVYWNRNGGKMNCATLGCEFGVYWNRNGGKMNCATLGCECCVTRCQLFVAVAWGTRSRCSKWHRVSLACLVPLNFSWPGNSRNPRHNNMLYDAVSDVRA
jgi:hypothetical protein